jgi:hypothetical protein
VENINEKCENNSRKYESRKNQDDVLTRGSKDKLAKVISKKFYDGSMEEISECV